MLSAATNLSPEDIDQKIVQAKIDPAQVDRAHILAAIKAVESADGKLLNHVFIDDGPHQGERAIGPYAFLPSTMQELISKSPRLKQKYSKILTLPFGNQEQSQIEAFVSKHPQIHDDLANEYVDQIMKRTSAKTAGQISQAWLYGIKGYNRQVKQKVDMNSPRFTKAQATFDKSKQGGSI